MSDSPALSHFKELTKDNLELHLQEDDSFLDYFNTHLALPCFTERLFYNKETKLFEEFIEKLTDEEEKDSPNEKTSNQQHFKLLGSTVSDGSEKQSRICYYVFVLDKEQGLQFVKEHRFRLFLRSQLHAEWKLSQTLSAAQASFLKDQQWNEDFDQDSVVEDTSDEEKGRRSTVSFNLTQRNVDETRDRDAGDSDFNLPRHFRPIQDTFDAWWDCFSKQNNGTSLQHGAEAASRLSVYRNPEQNELVLEGSVQKQSCLSDTGTSAALQETEEVESAEQGTASTVSYHERPSDKADSTSAVSFLTEQDGEDNFGNESPHDSSRAEIVSGDNVVLSVNAQITASYSPGNDKELTQDICTGAVDADSSDLHSKDENSAETIQNSFKKGYVSLEMHDAVQNFPKDASENGESSRGGAAVDAEQLFVGNDVGVCLEELNGMSASNRLNNCHEEAKDAQSNISRAGKMEMVVSSSETASSIDTGDAMLERERLVVHDGSRGENEDNETILRGTEFSSSPSEPVEALSLSNGFYEVQELPAIHGNAVGATDTQVTDLPPSTVVTTRSETTESENMSDVRRALQSGDSIGLGSDDESLITRSSDRTDVRLTAAVLGTKSGPGQKTSDSPVEEHKSINDFDDGATAQSKQSELKEGREPAEILPGAQNEATDDVTDTDTHVSSLQGIRGLLSARPSSMNTSVAFDGDDASLFTEGNEPQQEEQYDLATRHGVDNFKTFLVSTSGEKLVKFWLDVESGKHLQTDDERTRFVQNIRDKFWRSGGILELPVVLKRKLQLEDASRLSYDSICGVQELVLESLSSYWCPRFTMHYQHKSQEYRSLEYVRMAKLRPRSCVRREQELSDVPQHAPHPGLALHVTSGNKVRPHSSYVSTQTPKKQWRAKSAHPRLRLTLDTMHTNAGDLQLQNFTAPIRKSYGFEQPKAPSFPADPEPDYLSSVRLYINPVPSPESRMQKMLRSVRRTAVQSAQPRDDHNGQCISEPNDDTVIDSLLQGLFYEDQSGSFFEAFLYKAGNQLWLNCLAFWKTLQQFNVNFYADVLNPAELTKKARFMYANFILTASAQDLGVNQAIQKQVFKQLEPAYEELFDAVEDHVLTCLLEPWGLCLKQERERYSKVSKEQILRHMEIDVVQRRRESIDHAKDFEGDTENMEKEKISIEEANRPMPIPKDGFSFDTLIRNREEVENFKEFLSRKHVKGVKDLMAWTDMETFRRTPHTVAEKRNQKAKEVRGSWLTKKYFFGPDSPATREGQNLIISLNGGPVMKERPSSPVVLESQKFVRARIERRWLEAFKQTAEFIERQKPRSAAVQEMVEDLMLKRRLQRSEAAWKILNTKWVSSSRDVVALRQSLLRADKCAEFKAYLATKGETLEADVMFWLEVQKFKDMCHAHAQDSLIRKKVQTIVECFLNSAVTPELQIDIPIEMAEKLLEKVTGRSPTVHPYVFREAQMTVFRVLYNHWKDYNAYRSRIPEGRNALEFLSEQLRKHRADMKAKKDASERRRLARLSAERRKKEKEERDKKRMEDLSSLFSMDSTSMLNGEEEERCSWHYSKHMVELERQEHIQRLREQGIVVPDDEMTNSDDKHDCSKSRRSKHSMARSSTHTKTDEGKLGWKQTGQDGCSDKRSSDGSVVKSRKKLLNVKQEYTEQSTTLSPPSGRRGSLVSNATRITSAVSIRSGKETASDKRSVHEKLRNEGPAKTRNAAGKLKSGVTSTTSDKATKGRKVSEIQVIELEVADERDTAQDLDLKGRSKLLSYRTQQRKRLILADQGGSKEAQKVPLDAISCISDYSAISNIDYSPKKTATRRVRPGATTPLTSKSLKDFTNSPEGAPMAMPLPLVRITSASYIEPSDGDGSAVDQSPLVLRPRSSPHMSTLGRRTGKRTVQMTKSCGETIPDVIVN